MPDERVEELFEREGAGPWVGIEVVMLAFGVKRRRAYQLARAEEWRHRAGTRAAEYCFEDVRVTWTRSKEQP